VIASSTGTTATRSVTLSTTGSNGQTKTTTFNLPTARPPSGK
jgi:hypothetical protein